MNTTIIPMWQGAAGKILPMAANWLGSYDHNNMLIVYLDYNSYYKKHTFIQSINDYLFKINTRFWTLTWLHHLKCIINIWSASWTYKIKLFSRIIGNVVFPLKKTEKTEINRWFQQKHGPLIIHFVANSGSAFKSLQVIDLNPFHCEGNECNLTQLLSRFQT